MNYDHDISERRACLLALLTIAATILAGIALAGAIRVLG